MKVYVYTDLLTRNLVYKTLERALEDNKDLEWVVFKSPRDDDSTQCIAQTFYRGSKITICELEVME